MEDFLQAVSVTPRARTTHAAPGPESTSAEPVSSSSSSTGVFPGTALDYPPPVDADGNPIPAARVRVVEVNADDADAVDDEIAAPPAPHEEPRPAGIDLVGDYEGEDDRDWGTDSDGRNDLKLEALSV